MRSTDLAWIAGFYEGEGYTGCYTNRRKDWRNPKIIRTYYTLKSVICQREKLPLLHIQKVLGFGSLFRQRGGYKNRWCWYWSASSAKARSFVKLVQPYLQSDYKREQIRIALKKDKANVKPK